MRARSRAARIASAALVLLVPAALSAQARCEDGTLGDYLALGATGCRLGRFTFANFTLENEILAQNNATIFTPDLGSLVAPFRRGAVLPGFGFVFEELFNGVELNTSAANARGRVRTTFSFTFASAVREIWRTRIVGGVFVTEDVAPDDMTGRAHVDVAVAEAGGGSTCLDFGRTRVDGEAGLIYDVAETCTPDALSSGVVTYVFESSLRRTGGTGPVEGLAASGVIVAAFRGQRIGASVVPEPTTIALLGAGLVTLVGTALARRRG
jgi:hypothetical protein